MPLNVVYLDDEKDLCELFEELYSSEKIAVTAFSDPKLAVESINHNPPDIIFMDYRLPHTTGDEVADRILVSVPIYLISGDFTINVKFPFRKVFPKPLPTDAIRKLLETAYEQKIETFKKTV